MVFSKVLCIASFSQNYPSIENEQTVVSKILCLESNSMCLFLSLCTVLSSHSQKPRFSAINCRFPVTFHTGQQNANAQPLAFQTINFSSITQPNPYSNHPNPSPSFLQCLSSPNRPHIIQLFIEKLNNFKKIALAMTTLTTKFLQDQSNIYSLTLSTLFPNDIEEYEEREQTHLFHSDSLEDYLTILKRVHLNVPNIPMARLIGDFHQRIEIGMRVYARTLLSQVARFSHQEKLDQAIALLQTYQQLAKEYGYFLITHDHVRLDQQGNVVLWINPNYAVNESSHPLANTGRNVEQQAVEVFIETVKQYFSMDFFKYRKIQSFGQLASYLEFIKKRNKIHKNCQSKARELSESKRRNTMSTKSLRDFDTPQKRGLRGERPISSFSTLLHSNILSRGSYEKFPSQSLLNNSVSRISVSKGSSDSKKIKSQVDTTIYSTEMKYTRNMSYLQLSNVFQCSQKKSCVFGSNPEVVAPNIKHSSVLSRDINQSSFNPNFCSIQYKKKQEPKIKEEAELQQHSFDQKNELQIGLQSLLLSQINQDPENQTGGSELRKRQHLQEAIDEFESLLFN